MAKEAKIGQEETDYSAVVLDIVRGRSMGEDNNSLRLDDEEQQQHEDAAEHEEPHGNENDKETEDIDLLKIVALRQALNDSDDVSPRAPTQNTSATASDAVQGLSSVTGRATLPGAWMGSPGMDLRPTTKVNFALLSGNTDAHESNSDEESGKEVHDSAFFPNESDHIHQSQPVPIIEQSLELQEALQSTPPDNNNSPPAQDLLIAHEVFGESSNKANWPTAEELDVAQTRKRKQRRKAITKLVLVGTIVGVIAVLFWLFTVLVRNHDLVLPEEEEERDNSYPHHQQSAAPSSLAPSIAPSFSAASYLYALFPNYTQDPAVEDSNSPQARAARWIWDDPNLLDYSAARILQRYALAVLYLSTNGDEWKNNTFWLSYDVHECDWAFMDVDQYIADLFFLPGFYQYYQPATTEIMMTEMGETMTDTFPCAFSSTGELLYTELWLINNNLQGTLPLELYLLTSIRSLLLGSDELVGSTLSTQIGMLTSLETIAFGNVGLAGTLPTELGLLSKLGTLFLSSNKIEGTIPSQLGLLTSLSRDIDLAQNLLTGTLPTELGLLSQANSLFIFSNSLTSSVPSQIGSMELLRVVALGNNQFNSTIPSELGFLERLKLLHLDRNQFSGVIPSQLGQLQQLIELDLHDNNLTNGIISELGLLTDLLKLNLDDNQLSGSVPEELNSLAANNGSLIALYLRGNNLLSGTISNQLCDIGKHTSCPLTIPVSDSIFGCGLKFDCSDLLCGCDDCACPSS